MKMKNWKTQGLFCKKPPKISESVLIVFIWLSHPFSSNQIMISPEHVQARCIPPVHSPSNLETF